MRRSTWGLGTFAFVFAGANCSSNASGGYDENARLAGKRVTELASRDRVIADVLGPGKSRFADREGALTAVSLQDDASTLRADAAERASQATELRIGTTRGVRFALVGASASPARLDQGRVVYADALPNVDRVLGATDHLYEDGLVVRDPSAGSTFSWRIDGPSALWGHADRGGLDFVDASGRAAFRIAPPRVIDAGGTRRSAELAWNDETHTLRVSFDPKGLSYPVLVDPLIETWKWSGMTLGPPVGPAAFDASRNEVITYIQYSLETWRYDGAGWVVAARGGPPSAGSSSSMVYDAARGETVYFTGSETWTWNGALWTKKMPATTPSTRSKYAMAYDGARNLVVLFGGEASTVTNETYTWNGTTWTRVLGGAVPPARVYPSMAFDAVRSEIVMYGGKSSVWSTATYFTDTWTWNGTSWTLRSPTSNPGRRESADMVYDGARNTTLLVGGTPSGDTPMHWSWNGSSWAPIATPSSVTYAGALAYDPTRRLVVGRAGEGTLTFDGSAWDIQPDFPDTRSAVYDASRGELVTLVAHGVPEPTPRTYVWNKKYWARVIAPSSPPNADAQALFYDEVRRKVVAVVQPSSGLPQTWLWDGAARTWTHATSATGLPVLPTGPWVVLSAAFDRSRNQGVLVSYDDSGASISDTYTWDGTRWAVAGAGPSAFGPARIKLVYDGKYLNRVITPVDSQTVGSWNGTSWVAHTVGPTILGSDLIVASDPIRHDVVAIADTDGVAYLWTGADWAEISTAGGPDYVWGLMHDGRSFIADGASRFLKLGGSCTTNEDCPSAFCTDGVCCDVQTCATCETCRSAMAPGQCQAVMNAEDPDTCAARDGKTCTAVGTCLGANGAAATTAADCASGFVADGVCCNSACAGRCQACRADMKEAGPSGLCDFAKAGSDARDDCATEPRETCGQDGTCNGLGRCRLYPEKTPCGEVSCTDSRATSRICNGLGMCSAAAEGVPCEAYVCKADVGCATSCATSADCAMLHHCEDSKCVPDRGATCESEHTIVAADGTRKDCGLYKCEGAACKTACVNASDCVSPAVCNFEKACIVDAPAAVDSAGCSAGLRPRAASSWGVGFAVTVLGCCRWSKRRPRRKSNPIG